jgi:putative copper resistance protein D
VLDDPLIWVRAIHFAATIVVAGTIFFQVLIAEPSFSKGAGTPEVAIALRKHLTWHVRMGLAVAVLSGSAWFVFVAAQIADIPRSMVFSDTANLSFVLGTDFGRDWVTRFVLAVLLAFLFRRNGIVSYRGALMSAVLATALVGSLAWAGHGAADPGAVGVIHLGADTLHLIAAAAWIGALVPLAILLSGGARDEVKREAVLRFSRLGVLSVATLVATGIANGLFLIGSLSVLVGTRYGLLLLFKISLFIVMLGIAGVNRVFLTPRLVRLGWNGRTKLLQQLRNNTLAEVTVGSIIILVVAILGTLPPAA